MTPRLEEELAWALLIGGRARTMKAGRSGSNPPKLASQGKSASLPPPPPQVDEDLAPPTPPPPPSENGTAPSSSSSSSSSPILQPGRSRILRIRYGDPSSIDTYEGRIMDVKIARSTTAWDICRYDGKWAENKKRW